MHRVKACGNFARLSSTIHFTAQQSHMRLPVSHRFTNTGCNNLNFTKLINNQFNWSSLFTSELKLFIHGYPIFLIIYFLGWLHPLPNFLWKRSWLVRWKVSCSLGILPMGNNWGKRSVFTLRKGWLGWDMTIDYWHLKNCPWCKSLFRVKNVVCHILCFKIGQLEVVQTK